MRKPFVQVLAMTLTLSAAACRGSADEVSGGSAKVTIAGQAFDVNNLTLSYETGADGYFRLEGNDAAHADQDCRPGLGGGLALYGDLPSTVTSLADLEGRELPFEFTGDGDDFNLCFVGSNGLLGVETGTVRFADVEGTNVAFSFSGSFAVYDGEGGQASSPVDASGAGMAQAVTN
jgi:hypothetical protein